MIKQIVQVHDPTYLNAHLNFTTSIATDDVHTILAYLFLQYGAVEVEILSERELNVCKMQYNILDPLVTMYNDMKDPKLWGFATNNLYSPAQRITFALHIIKIR